MQYLTIDELRYSLQPWRPKSFSGYTTVVLDRHVVEGNCFNGHYNSIIVDEV